MSIRFQKKDNLLILQYIVGNGEWILQKLQTDGEIMLKRVFTFVSSDQIAAVAPSIGSESFEFVVGVLVGEYFKIESRKLNTRHDVYIHKDIQITHRFFIASRDVSIFKRIDELLGEDIYIGGNNDTKLPEEEFSRIVKRFPTAHELGLYVEARITSVLKNYFNSVTDSERQFNRYMNRRAVSVKGEDIYYSFKDQEIEKYITILAKLKGMLDKEDLYTERQWQREMLQILLLLYPKYTYVFENTPVSDDYSGTDRFLDYLLVDSEGHIDIIEIKKPFENCIVTKSTYRDNYVPLRELSGTIMQIEKYVFYLNRWGKRGEKYLSTKYKDRLPKKFDIKIVNPCGLIVMGRDKGLNVKQKRDFEVIKRKYKNVIDILTYDDLIRRLEFVIEQYRIGVTI